MSDKVKRTISFGVFGFGIFGGLWGFGAWYLANFASGGNDSLLETVASMFAFATPVPACILALWKRLLAGYWLIFAGAFFPCGVISQRAWMVYGGQAPDTVLLDTVLCLLVSGPLIGFGLFGILTEGANWPKLL
jgi:hypothetical protein